MGKWSKSQSVPVFFRQCPSLIPRLKSPFFLSLLRTCSSYHPLLLLLFSNQVFHHFLTLLLFFFGQALAFHLSLQGSFDKKSRGSRGDVVSPCKCHFVSSEGGRKEAEGKSMRERVHVERCHSLLCPFRLREAVEERRQKERGRRRWG